MDLALHLGHLLRFFLGRAMAVIVPVAQHLHQIIVKHIH
jgi:hypothetical protein